MLDVELSSFIQDLQDHYALTYNLDIHYWKNTFGGLAKTIRLVGVWLKARDVKIRRKGKCHVYMYPPKNTVLTGEPLNNKPNAISAPG